MVTNKAIRIRSKVQGVVLGEYIALTCNKHTTNSLRSRECTISILCLTEVSPFFIWSCILELQARPLCSESGVCMHVKWLGKGQIGGEEPLDTRHSLQRIVDSAIKSEVLGGVSERYNC